MKRSEDRMHYRPETIRYSMEDAAPAAAMLLKGGLVALPTETVSGWPPTPRTARRCWCSTRSSNGSATRPSAVLVTGMEMVEKYCQNIPPQGAYRLAEKYWPGPLTMILEDKGVVSPATTGEGDTLGVRCPDHPVTYGHRQAGVALAAPSANPADQPQPQNAQEVLDYFDGHMEGIVDGGPLPVGVESTIVDLTGAAPVILREGAIPGQELLDVLSEG